jgi:hypothetical protein
MAIVWRMLLRSSSSVCHCWCFVHIQNSKAGTAEAVLLAASHDKAALVSRTAPHELFFAWPPALCSGLRMHALTQSRGDPTVVCRLA